MLLAGDKLFEGTGFLRTAENVLGGLTENESAATVERTGRVLGGGGGGGGEGESALRARASGFMAAESRSEPIWIWCYLLVDMF